MIRFSVLEAACAAFVVCVSAVGCRSKSGAAEPLPVVAPALEYGARHFVGTVLSGPLPQHDMPEDVDPSDALAVHCVLTYYERLPHFDLPPLGTQARLIGTLQGDTAILANPIFTTRVQYVAADAAQQIMAQLSERAGERSLVLNDFEGALLPGSSVVFAARSVDTLRLDVDTEAQRRVAFSFSRDETSRVEFGIVIDQLLKPTDDEPDDSAAAALEPNLDPYLMERENRVLQREFVMLEDPPSVDGGPILVLVPSPFPNDEGAGFAMKVELGSAPTEEPAAGRHADIVSAMLDDFVQERQTARESARRLDSRELRDRQVAEALRNLQLDRLQRRTLVFLTTTTGAPLAQDLVLIAKEENLQKYAQAVIAAAERSDAVLNTDGGLGWILERGAFQFLITALSDEEINASHLGLLLKHAGEAGNFPAIIEDSLAISSNRDEFVQRIIEENRIFLEDHNIAARVRAFDWLDSRDAAPAGYDPLADADARRSALAEDRKQREAREAAKNDQGAKS